MDRKRLFDVSANYYSKSHDFSVYYPASLDQPCDHAVMFINEMNRHRILELSKVKHCIVFCPLTLTVPEEIEKNNLFIRETDPRTAYCLFFREHSITNRPSFEEVNLINGAHISPSAVIGEETVVMPFAYIGSEGCIGQRCYVGAGVKLVGRVKIGDDVTIRENSVIGADGLSTDRDKNGQAATMPQFGGVTIGDRVQIGALTVIARGAIDDTVIAAGAKIDNSTFISHNVKIGEDTFIVGETIFFGGSSTGKGVFVSGNTTVRNKRKIGDHAIVGMGSVVTKDVKARATVCGNPAHFIKEE